MALRRREKRTAQSKIDATPPWETRRRDEPEPTTGPWDVTDAPDDDVARIDLGGLLIPVVAGMDIRLDTNESQQVVSVTVTNPSGHMQLGVFAAPRNERIWDEVRSEIKQSIVEQGGAARDKADGLFGPEVLGRLKTDGGGTAPARFIGVEGPRWFLRALLVGTPATEAAKAAPFERMLRDIVVVRGSDPLPAREQVPLRLPKEAIEASAAAEDDGTAQ